MSLNIKNLTIKNFLSIGNVTQSVNFINQNLVLVLGENLDLGGNDNRNGVGKSAILNALSYGLFGVSLSNIRKDNLINATNAKHMMVTLSFEVNGVNYKIERGRKPGIFRFFKEDKLNTSTDDENESQGENRHTQQEIESIIGISHDMFKHIVALNTYVEPFLSLRANDQRIIIEQLLGITKLSEKAEILKEEIKLVKDSIKEEEFRISAIVETNKRIEDSIKLLYTKVSEWDNAKETRVAKLQHSILELLSLDIDTEIRSHQVKQEVADLTAEYKALTKDLKNIDKEIASLHDTIASLDRSLSLAAKKTCPTCSQGMADETHMRVHTSVSEMRADAFASLNEKIEKQRVAKELSESVSIPKSPITYYKSIDEAYKHKSKLDQLGNSLTIELDTVNPYIDQIKSLKDNGIQVIDFTVLNELVSIRDHQETLLKLLTSKDSFIRRKIIDQNLSFLNSRLGHYLSEIGLPHAVKFRSDLDVEIMLFGKDFDFDNLSRGERTRLILSLSWAFRDAFEAMNGKINLLFIDELVDNGIDAAGTESVLRILKDMSRGNGRNIYLISHRDEFVGRVNNILKVVKEGGFSTFDLYTSGLPNP